MHSQTLLSCDPFWRISICSVPPPSVNNKMKALTGNGAKLQWLQLPRREDVRLFLLLWYFSVDPGREQSEHAPLMEINTWYINIFFSSSTWVWTWLQNVISVMVMTALHACWSCTASSNGITVIQYPITRILIVKQPHTVHAATVNENTREQEIFRTTSHTYSCRDVQVQ